jgi:hypothetical protein
VSNLPDRDLFEGTWKISEAETLTGVPYDGTVQITRKRGRYEVNWKSSASNYSGIGLADGNKLCVAWGSRGVGVVVYKIGENGTLKGRWWDPGAAADKSDGLENAIGGSPGKIEGTYTVKGANPAGEGSYEGKLKITRTGETYQVQWDVADRLMNGVGVKIDDRLFVAWGDKEPFGVVGYTFDGATAKGVWTLPGARRTATENLTK